MEEQLKPIIARCQTCQTPTERRCSVCNVCIYCSSDCEAKAATMCFADVACELHRSLPYEDANLGPAAAHFLMLPSTQTDLTKRASPQHTAVDGAAQRRRALPAHPPSCLLALARGSQDRLRHGRRAHARVSLLVRLPADQLSLWQDEPGGGWASSPSRRWATRAPLRPPCATATARRTSGRRSSSRALSPNPRGTPLTVRKPTQQVVHFDSIYVTPPTTRGRCVACSPCGSRSSSPLTTGSTRCPSSRTGACLPRSGTRCRCSSPRSIHRRIVLGKDATPRISRLDGGNRTQPSARCAPHRGSPRCVLWRITGWGYGAGAEKDGRRTTRRETQAWSRHLSLARSYHHPGSRELC